MSVCVYLLRQPVSTLSSALLTSGEHEFTVVPVEETVSDLAPLTIGQSQDPSVKQRKSGPLNYRDLLNVIINARKVIIL